MELSEITIEHVMELPELKPLNDRQRAFVVFFASTGRARESMIRAGYSQKNAQGNCSKIVSRLRPAIDAVRNWYFDRETLSRGEALALLSQMARSNLADAVDDSGEIKPSRLRRIRLNGYSQKISAGKYGDSVSRSVKIIDQRAAIESIAKIAGWDKIIPENERQINVSIRREF